MANEVTPRAKLIREVMIRLGGNMIDIELDDDSYNVAMDYAFSRYRQRSTNAIEESFVFLDVQPNVAIYTMPAEVQQIMAIYRNTIGGAGGGASIDPFSLAFTNNIYMMQNPGGLGGSGAGFLATYDFAMQFQNLAGRMFGREMMYTFDPVSKRLFLQRKFTSVEQILIHVWNERPEASLLADVFAKPWLRDYTVAICKQMLGEARSKFQSLAGPSGGISLNGDALKTEAAAELERLDKEITDYIDASVGGAFFIG